MIFNDLFYSVLLEPAQYSNTLFIISGYASSEFASTHLSHLPNNIKVYLIIGMATKEGISQRNHNNFISLMQNNPGRFECFYSKFPIHTKSYAWFYDDKPIIGFTGSTNYSQNAFLGLQEEAVATDSPNAILSYFTSALSHSIPCTDPNVNNLISITQNTPHVAIDLLKSHKLSSIMNTNPLNNPSQTIHLTLLTQNGNNVPSSSGINWGQRDNRNRNEAYIAVPSNIYNTNFFPPIGTEFILFTDDGTSLTCVRAQENGKAIETKYDNSLLGLYLRQRIGVISGSFVTLQNLLNYGRTDVTITKLSNNFYYMDFSV